MKWLMCVVVCSSVLSAASCASPLERIVEVRRQERIDSYNAQRPVSQGAADGIGSTIAESGERLTLDGHTPAPSH